MCFAGNTILRFILPILFFFSSQEILSQKKRTVNLSDFINGQRILFLGDSITQDGRYVSFIEYYFNTYFRQNNIDIISIGLSSETVSGLTEPGHPYKRPCLFDRLDSALAKIKPQTVVACYGMNDGIYHPQSGDRMKAYQDGINKLIDKVKAINAKLVIITPPMFDTISAKFKPVADDSQSFGYSKPFHRYDAVLGDYAKWITNLKVPGVCVIDLHSEMTDYVLKQRNVIPDFSFSKDGIHPQSEGHLFMAQQFMKGIGVDVTTDSLSSELKRLDADSLFMIVKQHREKRSKGWLEYIGYTLEKTVKTNEINSIEDEACLLQEKIEKEIQKPSNKHLVKERNNSLFFELGGSLLFGSMNYERIEGWFGFRVGIGVLPDFSNLDGCTMCGSYIKDYHKNNGFGVRPAFVIMLNSIIPLNSFSSKLELGAGITSLYPTFALGYNYEPQNSGYLFRITIITLYYIPWLGISFGHRF